MASNIYLFLQATLVLLSPHVKCANILAFVPTPPAKSHFMIMEPLFVELAARGHHVTMVSSFPPSVAHPNLTHVSSHSEENALKFNLDEVRALNLLDMPFGMVNFATELCDKYYRSGKLAEINVTRPNFDLVITESFAGNCYAHFAHQLGVPHVSIVTSVPLPWIPDFFGIPDNPSYIPNYLVSFSPEMSFLQRVVNAVSLLYDKVVFRLLADPLCQKMAEEYFQQQLPWVADVVRNSSLLLMNGHFSLSQGRPLPPNVVEIGGIHIKEKRPLPVDLQRVLDESRSGVIVLSFGTLVRLSETHKLDTMLAVFAKFPQTVIVKHGGNSTDAPKNVVFRKWLPQRDLLEHPKVELFISHGGLASTLEAVHCGVPVLGVPFFADQFQNINNLVYKGVAKKLDFDSMTEQSFELAINEVLSDSKYKENMKALSQQFRERPLGALQSARLPYTGPSMSSGTGALPTFVHPL